MSQRTRAYYMTHKAKVLARQKAFKEAHPDELKARQKDYYERKKPMFSARHLKANYGMTQAQYDQLLKEQNGACAICRKSANQFQRSLSVDHDHKTGQIRGLLCINCNLGLGCFNDSREFIANAMTYLRRAFYATTV